MPQLDIPQFLGTLALILLIAKLLGTLACRLGQPAVLGELIAGAVVGGSVLALVDPRNETLHALAEIGVVILLFSIGLETDLKQLLRVGLASTVVAVTGVALPFALGWCVCRLLGLDAKASIVVGASLTATSVGITARVLADLGRLRDPESQIVLGAAIIDDIIGLIILAVVTGIANGEEIALAQISWITAFAFGFLAIVLIAGRLLVPWLARLIRWLEIPGGPILLAVVLAFGLGWAAVQCGSAMIIGAFAAGLLLRETPVEAEIERGVAQLGHFFVPIFFVSVGAAVNVRLLDPTQAANWPILRMAGLLIVVAALGKFIAGYAPFWFRGRKVVIGVGMIPRGEVGLIFAQMGITSGMLNEGVFSAVAVMIMATTFLAPPVLKLLFPPRVEPVPPRRFEGIEELVTEP